MVTNTVREKLANVSSGSIGHVIPHTEVKLIKLDDKSCTPLGPGEQGEILIRVGINWLVNVQHSPISSHIGSPGDEKVPQQSGSH